MTSCFYVCPVCGSCFRTLHDPINTGKYEKSASPACPICGYQECIVGENYTTVLIVRRTIRAQLPQQLQKTTSIHHESHGGEICQCHPVK